MGSQLRKSARHRVHLSVRYGTASEFVVEYAKNLSQGGLFIAGAHELEPLSTVKVEMELPGSGSYLVTGEVAHIVTPKLAEQLGTTPGAGVAIKRAPKGFRDALSDYLQRLGRRRDVVVFAGDSGCAAVLADSGYQVQSAPAPERLAEACARAESAVIGVVVPRARVAVYRAAAAAAGAGDIVVEMGSPGELDRVLVTLDERL